VIERAGFDPVLAVFELFVFNHMEMK